MGTHETLAAGSGGTLATAPPGWYPVGRTDGGLRWWDGERWTEDVALPGTPGWPGDDLPPHVAGSAALARVAGSGARTVPHRPEHAHHDSAAAEVLHEMDVVGDDVSTSVVLAWIALVAVLSVAAPIVGASASASGIVAAMWAIGVAAAIGGAVPFWRGGHRAIAASGVLTALLVPLLLLAAMHA